MTWIVRDNAYNDRSKWHLGIMAWCFITKPFFVVVSTSSTQVPLTIKGIGVSFSLRQLNWACSQNPYLAMEVSKSKLCLNIDLLEWDWEINVLLRNLRVISFLQGPLPVKAFLSFCHLSDSPSMLLKRVVGAVARPNYELWLLWGQVLGSFVSTARGHHRSLRLLDLLGNCLKRAWVL